MEIRRDATKQNVIAQDIIRVASPEVLGRTPTRDEYIIHGNFTKHQIDIYCGGWKAAMAATGLEYAKSKRAERPDKQEIRKKVFDKLLIEADERRIVTPPKVVRRGLIWTDEHKPYQHPDEIAFVLAVWRKYKLEHCAHVGDGEDFQAINFHDHDPDLLSPGHELERVIELNQEIYKTIPEMEIAESNHGSMVYRKGKHHGLPRHVLKDYRDVLKAPIGYTWKLEIVWQLPNGQKVLIVHSLGKVLEVSKKRGMNVIQGHHHGKASIEYWSPCPGTVLFAVQGGCLADDSSPALAYNKNAVERPIISVVTLIECEPRLILMPMDSKGRWTGVVP